MNTLQQLEAMCSHPMQPSGNGEQADHLQTYMDASRMANLALLDAYELVELTANCMEMPQ